MNIFGIGLPEMVLILVVALLIFGPKKLPEIGSSLGKAIRGFQDATKDFENEFKREAKRIEEETAPTPVNLPDKNTSTVAEEKSSEGNG
ncbi:MAG TPA: TatA/E family twin arginine-targeting protein translocase [Oscillatoriales cyanobacterium M59_W2019_021]|nr:MAG: TatA/E family twin arginine-targeting protein translocase [Cyanobacteria bacterium J055]HIK33913.1 TatA/E family twin arginine-targeting protein translocase [Oscillatoriales cyanobacterium M4454_W2019_049]HIK51428.1 TatA/E family twin arginine-targeting protein translocase [Oscillatoriales cyanobacterium M59_W2019_021]